MAWRLEIHHIDVVTTGDATLIIAQEVPPLAGLVAQVRSVLIDGGRAGAAAAVQLYVAAQVAALDAIVVTHYDIDHLPGVTGVLRTGLCGATRIYDQGWPQNLSDIYISYARAINGLPRIGTVPVVAAGGRTRVTGRVLSDGIAPIPVFNIPAVAPVQPGALNRTPDWPLTGAGAPGDIFWDPGIVPPGAPRMTLIAVNGYVRDPAGGANGPHLGLGTDPRNEKSLAVLVRFGAFRYYAGGDIETPQEDYIQDYLNHNDDAAGRVLAMKASHHGARTSTSRGFVDQLRPEAAFISCGTRNRYRHPAQDTINVLDGYVANLAGANPAPAHAPAPPPPPYRPVPYYLTGYQTVAGGLTSRAGAAGETAGDPTVLPVVRGHVVVTVSAAQSAADVRGGLYLAVRAAANTVATTAGLAGVMGIGPAGAAAGAAAEAVMLSESPAAAANRFLTTAGFAAAGVAAGQAAAQWMAAGGAVTAGAVAAAALHNGAPAAAAAAAAAAAGTVVGGHTAASIQAAVNAALAGVGLGPGPAGIAAALAALQAVPAAGQFTVMYYDRTRIVNQQNVLHV